MADIVGIVKDENDIPIPNVSVLLTGGGITPQLFPTGIDGKFLFLNPPVGSYKLNVVFMNYFKETATQITATQVSNTSIDIILNLKSLKMGEGENVIENKYVVLKYLQYIFLGGIGWFFFSSLIAERIPNLSLDKLNNIETARGAITYLVAVTTISMAAILMLSAIMTGGKDLDKRFALGKEILTLLIGILGTVIGFYYGSSNKSGSENKSNPVLIDSLQVIQKDREVIQKDREVILTAKVTGGRTPFIYSILSDPKGKINNIKSRIVKNGEIQDTLNLLDSVKSNFPVKFIISGKDSDDLTFNKELELIIVK